MAIIKRLLIILVIVSSPLIIGMLFTYDIIKIEWVSFMEIQPSYRPMEDPLPLPVDSVPLQGVSIIPELGAPVNPVASDQASIDNGQSLYTIHCSICHGPNLDGNGTFSAFLQNKPSNLLTGNALTASDGYIFVVITKGLEGKMPSLAQNLPVVENRWDVVNYIRSVQNNQ
jgi:mono/diheme cytochrome c family protein